MFFSIVQLRRLVFLKPLRVQRRYVPHLKGLIDAKVDLKAQGRDSTFTFRHALLEKAILHYKIEFGQRLLHRTVFLQKNIRTIAVFPSKIALFKRAWSKAKVLSRP